MIIKIILWLIGILGFILKIDADEDTVMIANILLLIFLIGLPLIIIFE